MKLKESQITVRVSNADKDLIRRLADVEHRTISNFIISLVKDYATWYPLPTGAIPQ